MNARMVQMGFLFNKFYRIVRDASNIEKKDVQLQLKGTEVEIDRNILKIMSDSLIHLVRNSVSHGIEDSEMRERVKKPKTGTITLSARHEKDNIIITVSDDGKGIDAAAIKKKIISKGLVTEQVAEKLSDDEIIQYIFESGFSNAEKVTEISGRGVGMDVVRRAVESIGGQVKIETKVGEGTSIHLSLPSSLALKGALLFEVDKQEYAVGLSYTEAVISIKRKDIHKISRGLMTKFQEKTISVVFLSDLIKLQRLSGINEKGVLHNRFNELEPGKDLEMIVVSHNDRLTGIVVDRLLQQKEIIEKPLPKPLDKVKILSGSTILGNGNVCPVVDVTSISDMLYKSVTLS
jgi:two-component system chemotaxis sensor kinase CheA